MSRPDEILAAAAETFRERNALYGENYKNVGPAMAALFPAGAVLRSPDDFARFHLFELLVVKLSRFAVSGPDSGSVHDACVYAAMLEGLIDEKTTPINNIIPPTKGEVRWSHILVTGSGSGLGSALVAALRLADHDVIEFDHANGKDVRDPAGTFGATPAALDVLINCAGVNKTGWLEDVAEADWDEVMDVNAKGIFKMTQWALPKLIESKGTVVNIVSNAAFIPMTCSAAYNASKGAAHILTLQLARELTKKNGITVFGIAPNKMAGTGMSRDIERQVVAQRGWTPEQASAYQLAALLPGKETPPARVAEFIAFLLSDRERHRYLSGTVLPYGA